ncbi:hypothetical protein HFO91_30475 [Rhizobium leguminosarum]|uniref:hypothetical protein n=1 Tax=Rhizobium leguminosarum TaxID=384 RepID=UPI001C94E7D4|nr:hypothetical protein [Rhizobium leguminosarum]MBY5453906.1 hypothetical protein [Rhizobium leguminosarum]
MKPPLLHEIAKAAIDHKTSYREGGELNSYQQLANDLARLRSMVFAQISGWSDGQDYDAADQFAISVLVFHNGKTVRHDRFGYSAQGLYRAAITAKWYAEMRKYDTVAIHFTEDGFAEFLNDATTAHVIETAKVVDNLAPLRDWCWSHMQKRFGALWE